MSLAVRLLLAVAMFFSADALLFRTSWHTKRLEPDSSTAAIDRIIGIERDRLRQPARYHVVAVGDSRMTFFVRFGNERWGGEGFRFGTLTLGGALPRCWPYLLRAVDPEVSRYAAIIIPLNDFDDIEVDETLAARASDLRYLAGQLRISDLPEFAASYPDWPERWHAIRAILFRGFAYQRDLRAYLEAPAERLEKVRVYRQWEQWTYNYAGETRSLAGLEIDRKNKTAKIPAGVPDSVRREIENLMLPDLPADRGAMRVYRRKWLGKLVDRYRDSKTRLIFLRLPRGPIPRPDPRAPNPTSAVRQFAKEPHVTLVDEHFFDSLERPELFMDPLHLNRPGFERFSVMLADEVHRILTRS